VISYSIQATVAANPPAVVRNSAKISCPDAEAPECNSDFDLPSTPIVSITKTSDVSEVSPGGVVTYVVTASNVGAVVADGSVVTDAIPAGIESFTWKCDATGGAVCPQASGTGAINQTIATFPVDSAVRYTITATVTRTTPPAEIDNVAILTPPPLSVCDPGNTPAPCTDNVVVETLPEVSIDKAVNKTEFAEGGSLTYTLLVTNTGGVDAPNTGVSDPIPAGITSFTWQCSATGGAVCPNVSGTGAINETIATFPTSSAVTYVITATVSESAPVTITNVVVVDPPNECAPNGNVEPCEDTVTSHGPALAITGILVADQLRLGAGALGVGIIILLIVTLKSRRTGRHIQ
jgi:uncharacterized repeat protein (TIGR01451 family)